ncbi:hypothetical protein GEMRC1_006326 [Eukaryota sp. GEM-RC1]
MMAVVPLKSTVPRFSQLFWSIPLLLCTLVFQFLIPLPLRDFDVNDFTISHKHVPETVSPTILIIVATLSFVIVFYMSFRKQQLLPRISSGCIAVAFSYSLNLFVVHFFKALVGRLRPDFLSRCALVDGECTGVALLIREGRLSFPSGHTGTAFHFASFLCFIVDSSFGLNYKNSFVPPNIIAFLPLVFGASFVGVSRITDYRHHVSDVVVGGLIGIITGYYGFFCSGQMDILRMN